MKFALLYKQTSENNILQNTFKKGILMQKSKILIVCDSFKESFTSIEANNIIHSTIENELKNIEIKSIPMTDGGEYAIEIYKNIVKDSKIEYIDTIDPLFRKIKTPILITNDEILIEVQKIIGLTLIENEKRNPLFTSTFGLGIVLKKIFDEYPDKKIIISLGGSGTCDMGIGMLEALGYKFYDKFSLKLKAVAKNFSMIKIIDIPNLKNINKIKVLTDVNIYLYGKEGCAYIFAPQKGASKEDVEYLDKGIKNLADIFYNEYKIDLQKIKGGGSAGGLGASISGILGGEIESGFDFFSKKIMLEEKIRSADIIITGEGRFDESSLKGKLTQRITNLSKKYKKDIYIICGKQNLYDEEYKKLGIKKVFSCFDDKTDIHQLLKNKDPQLETALKETTKKFISCLKS